MIYPAFLKKGDCVGVTAPSAGVDAAHLPGYEQSLLHLRARGWRVQETANVRQPNLPSSSAVQRAREVRELALDDEVQMIACAAGGDFLLEMLPYVDWETLRRHPKWVQGYSDPTGLLFPITTRLDIATIYGPNAGGYDMPQLHVSLEASLGLLGGKLPVQHSFSHYEPLELRGTCQGYQLTQPVRWDAPFGGFSAAGRLLGGCLDVLESLRGTPFEDVRGFVERYEDDGVLWYFDVFGMTAEQVFYSLWSMKQAGWFRTAKGFVFGRVMLPHCELLTYRAAVCRALGEVPVVLDADVGHLPPAFTLINGAMGRLTVENGGGSLTMELK